MTAKTTDDSETEREFLRATCEKDEFVRLTTIVREQYTNYLERLLKENVYIWCQNNSNTHFKPIDEIQVKQRVMELEEQAVRASMMARAYQRKMVKIISSVRHDTANGRLDASLYEILHKNPTMTTMLQNHNKFYENKATQTNNVDDMYENTTEINNYLTLSLEEKIDLFRTQVKKHQQRKQAQKQQQQQRNQQCERLSSPIYKQNATDYGNANIRQSKRKHSPENDINKKTVELTPKLSSTIQQQQQREIIIHSHAVDSSTDLIPSIGLPVTNEIADDDEVDRSLALLFGDDHGLEHTLGDAANNDQNNLITTTPKTAVGTATATDESGSILSRLSPKEQEPISSVNRNKHKLSTSIWPCELYYQQCQLSATLSHLIEKDLRLHDIIREKFTYYFGEDSDEEFAICSPSIDLNEVLINSCITRISPWLIEFLMKPLRDGTIANRFLFKKLAKKLAHSIIIEDQYASREYVKRVVEYFFCIKGSVRTIEDLEIFPRIEKTQIQMINS